MTKWESHKGDLPPALVKFFEYGQRIANRDGVISSKVALIWDEKLRWRVLWQVMPQDGAPGKGLACRPEFIIALYATIRSPHPFWQEQLKAAKRAIYFNRIGKKPDVNEEMVMAGALAAIEDFESVEAEPDATMLDVDMTAGIGLYEMDGADLAEVNELANRVQALMGGQQVEKAFYALCTVMAATIIGGAEEKADIPAFLQSMMVNVSSQAAALWDPIRAQMAHNSNTVGHA